MDVFLFRWSTTVQIASALVIAAFFYTLSLSVRRAELRPWVLGWLANLVALALTVSYWYLQPETEWVQALLRFGYTSFKLLFIVFLGVGAVAFAGAWWRTVPRLLPITGAVVVVAFLVSLLAHDIPTLGLYSNVVFTVVLGAAALVLVHHDTLGASWLVVGLLARSVLSGAEAVAYGVAAGGGAEPGSGVAFFTSAHSSFDTGAEWVIVLGCVVVLYRTIHADLEASNRKLRETRHTLQGVIDADPLTGLANERSVRPVMRSAFKTGATVFAFDIDGFRALNDGLGHHAGDDALRAFARALELAFRPGDHIVRVKDDEFLAVLPGALPDQVLGRIRTLRRRLTDEARTLALDLDFSVGHAYLAPGGDVGRAVAAAQDDLRQEMDVKRTGQVLLSGMDPGS